MKNPLTLFGRRSALPAQGPWRAMAELESEMDRWFGRALPGAMLTESIGFSPVSELEEHDNTYMLKMEIPGVNKDDVKIEVDGDRLTVSGERRESKEESGGARQHFCETYYGSFVRSFTLPQAINESKVRAHFENGILEITVPKTERTNVKTITIQ